MLRGVSEAVWAERSGHSVDQGLKPGAILAATIRFSSSEHRSEDAIPQFCGDSVVSARNLVMVEVMLH